MKQSDVKDKIIETASSLFYKKGYNSTGINEIIAESGIAKATLYNHFKSKEDICLSYLKFMNANFLKDIRIYAFSKSKEKAQILAIFDFLELFFNAKNFNGCWCINTVSEIPKNNTRIRSEIQYQKNLFIQLISELVEENMGKMKKDKRHSLACKIYLLYESAVAESNLHQADWPIKEAKNLCKLIIK